MHVNTKQWLCFSLERAFYVPSFSRNLIYVSRLIPLGFSFTFQDNVFNLFF